MLYNTKLLYDAFLCKGCHIHPSYVQVLITDQSVDVSTKLNNLLPALRRLATAKLTNEQAEELGSILDQLIV